MAEETTAGTAGDATTGKPGEGEQGNATATTGTGVDWQAESRKQEARAKENHKRATDLEERLSKFEEASKSEQEKALEKARKEAGEAVKGEYEQLIRTERLSSAIARAAAGKFQHPEDAERLLDLGDDVFDADGKPDAKAVSKAVEDFLKDRPEYSATGGRPTGDADAGRGDGGDAGVSMNDLLRQAGGIRR